MIGQRPGHGLKSIGGTIMLLGVFVLAGGLFLGEGERPRSAPKTDPPRAEYTLDMAIQSMPGILRNIYAALNDGRPNNASSFLNKSIFESTSSLDKLCQPFTYRSHYVESVVEQRHQQTKWFVARVRTLSKPF